MYNDMSVLEQHHCATTFRILTDQEGRCDILKNLAPEMRKECREIIISAILHTDMAKHFELTAKVRCVCVSLSLLSAPLLLFSSLNSSPVTIQYHVAQVAS